MDWLIFTFFSVVSRAIYGVLTKVVSTKVVVSVYAQAFLLTIAGSIISILLSPFFGGIDFSFKNVSLMTIILVVLSQGLGNIVYFAAIKNITNATAQIAFSSILIFNTILALLFLNLHLTPMNLLGIFILTSAILLVVSGKVDLNLKGVLLMVFSAFLFSIFQLSSSELSKQVSSPTYLFIAYMGSALVILVLKFKIIFDDISKSDNLRRILGIPLLAAIPSVGNFFFAYYAYRIAPQGAKVAMLLTSQVVFTVILSYFFLNEKSNIKKNIFAATLVVAAALLIKG